MTSNNTPTINNPPMGLTQSADQVPTPIKSEPTPPVPVQIKVEPTTAAQPSPPAPAVPASIVSPPLPPATTPVFPAVPVLVSPHPQTVAPSSPIVIPAVTVPATAITAKASPQPAVTTPQKAAAPAQSPLPAQPPLLRRDPMKDVVEMFHIVPVKEEFVNPSSNEGYHEKILALLKITNNKVLNSIYNKSVPQISKNSLLLLDLTLAQNVSESRLPRPHRTPESKSSRTRCSPKS